MTREQEVEQSHQTDGGAARVTDRAWLVAGVAMVVFFLLVALFYPFRYTFEFDFDEGLQLMRSFLQLRGHTLYADVFSDQPPLLNLALTGLFSLLGPKVTAARLVILASSTLLVGSLTYFIGRSWGPVHAAAAAGILLLLPFFVRLSVSVMIGIPSIALATACLMALFLWHRRGQRRWLLLSGLLLGASVMTKLFTSILLPLVAFGLLAPRIDQDEGVELQALFSTAIVWSGGFLAVVLPVLFLSVGPTHLGQLIQTHTEAQDISAYLNRAETRDIHFYLRDSIGILLLAAFGTYRAIRQRNWGTSYFIGWAVLAYLFLTQLIPVWYHHQLLITVPAAALAGVGLGELVEGARDSLRKGSLGSLQGALTLLALVASAFIVIQRVQSLLPEFDARLPNLRPGDQVSTREYEIVALMSDHKEMTDLVVADRPMFAFRVEKEVPPHLVVISQKRLRSGELSEQEVLATIRSEEPAQVVLARFEMETVESYLLQDYVAAYTAGVLRLYLRPDLVAEG